MSIDIQTDFQLSKLFFRASIPYFLLLLPLLLLLEPLGSKPYDIVDSYPCNHVGLMALRRWAARIHFRGDAALAFAVGDFDVQRARSEK